MTYVYSKEQKAAYDARRRASMERATAAIGDDGKTAWQRRWEAEFERHWELRRTRTGAMKYYPRGLKRGSDEAP